MEKKKIILKLAGAAALFLAIFLPGYSKYQELSQKNRLIEQKVEMLQLSNVRLENEIKRLHDDPAYMEKIARDKLKVTKKGEVVYKIIEEEKGQ
jgi:cell division protein FtsB